MFLVSNLAKFIPPGGKSYPLGITFKLGIRYLSKTHSVVNNGDVKKR